MKFSFAFILSFGLIVPFALHAAMSGGDFEIYADSIGFLDSSDVAGGDFSLYGSGSFEYATSSGGVYTLRGGFQAEEKGILQFSLSDGSVSLGSVTTTVVSSVVVTTTISTDSETGYTLYISDDGNLRSGGNDIDDVLDGAVDAGSEEYGFITSGSDALILSDTAITVSPTMIASTGGGVTNRQTEVEFRASAAPSTVEATYGHNVTFSVTVNP
jgi:hypothetical protein